MAGGVGLGLLGVGGVTVALELGVLIPRFVQLRRRLALLEEVLTPARREIVAEMLRLRQLSAELAISAAPHRRAWRLYRHPLTVALLLSYRRRRGR